jgi:antitoxin component YwqK of YwqJK toxin-antitoxin module
MKNIMFILLPLILIIGCTKSVDESTLIEKDGLLYQSDSDKPYSGEVFDLYDTGKNFYTGVFEQGKLVGDFVYYRKDGQIQEPLNYNDLEKKDGLTYSPNSDEPFSGEVVGLYTTGEKVLSGVFLNGHQTGDYSYFKKDGSLQEPLSYNDIVEKDGHIISPNSDGLFSGEVVGYNNAGNKVLSGFFHYGKRINDFSFFNNSGQLQIDTNIDDLEEIDGVLAHPLSGRPFSGRVDYNYPNSSNRFKQIKFLNGNPLGDEVIYFDKNGEIYGNFGLSELRYDYAGRSYYVAGDQDSISNGVISESFPTGEPLYRGVMFEGNWAEGPTYFNIDGTLSKPMKYPDQLDIRTNGVEEFVIKSTDSRYTGLVYSTHPNGKKKMEGLSIQGKKSGIWITWYSNGKTETMGQYHVTGNKTGLWGHYHEDTGMIKTIGRSIDGKEQGLWKYYDKNGKWLEDIDWVLGKKFEGWPDKIQEGSQEDYSSCNSYEAKSFAVNRIRSTIGNIAFLDLFRTSGNTWIFYGSAYSTSYQRNVTVYILISCSNGNYTVEDVNVEL